MFYDKTNQEKKLARQIEERETSWVKVCREVTDTEELKAEGLRWKLVGLPMNGSGCFFKDFFLHLWLIHVDVWHRPTQYFKAVILQLKTNIEISLFIWSILKSLLSLLQYHCIMFWFFGCKSYGILAPKQRIEPVPATVKGNVLTTGTTRKSLLSVFESSLFFAQQNKKIVHQLRVRKGDGVLGAPVRTKHERPPR